MHDTTLQAIDIGVMEVNEGDQGAMLAILTGLGLPIQDQNGQQVVVPTGRYQIPIGKPSILRLIDMLTQAAEKLPDPKPQSNLVVPGSMDEVKRAAQTLGQFQ